MRASKAATDLIRQFESLRLEAYTCPAGKLTIGYGHTRGVQEFSRITAEQAERLLAADVADVERDLLEVFPDVRWSQYAFDAMVSLAFNMGAKAIPVKAPKLTAAVRAGDWKTAGAELLDINKANGKVLPGLSRRRMAEKNLMEMA